MTTSDVACTQGSRPSELRREFQDEEYRYAYAEDFLNTCVATQIVTLREQRGLSQAKLGELIGTKQPGVSRLEDVNHSTWKTETLKKIARALGVRLRISFETFGTLLNEEARFCRGSLERACFEDDPAFVPRKEVSISTVSTPIASGETADTLINLVNFPLPENGIANSESRYISAGPASALPRYLAG